MTVDEVSFRQGLGHFASGLAVVTAVTDEGTPLGFTCQSLMSVSLDPPLISIAAGKDVGSWKGIRDVGSFSISVLRDDQEAIARLFATKGADKFGRSGWTLGGNGHPHLSGALAWIDGRVRDIHDGGDHEVVVAEIDDVTLAGEGSPLLFYRSGYRRLET